MRSYTTYSISVKREETLRRADLEFHVETGQAVVENGLTVTETGLSVVKSFKIKSVWSEDIEEDMITRNELSSESFQTCPAKDAKSIKAKPVVKEERDKSVREVISLGESKDSAAKSASAPSEKDAAWPAEFLQHFVCVVQPISSCLFHSRRGKKKLWWQLPQDFSCTEHTMESFLNQKGLCKPSNIAIEPGA
ncbi:uncharacterized protein [Hemitrygon akajei]|uniref:uncharacterized protein isoform X2 n=1 Tax=Hemitrygon akajei TaxID=2704970 RepID=UPI003BFA0563